MVDIEKIFTTSKESNKSIFAVKVKAGAKNNSIDGIICINNIWHLKLKIKAKPEAGKANIAIVDFLSKEWNVPQNAIKIIKGKNHNIKILSIIKIN